MTSMRSTNEQASPSEGKAISKCSNCQATISGPYCSQCGQEAEPTLKYFWTVVLHLLDDIFSFDSRANRTLIPLLTKPGFLTEQYIAGKRVHYVPPLRLYLFISIIFFLSLKFYAGSDSSFFRVDDSSRELSTRLSTYVQQQEAAQEEPGRLEDSMTESDLNRYKAYQKDLSQTDNKVLRSLAIDLVELELRRIETGQPFKEKRQQRYDNLLAQLAKARKGENVALESPDITIGNNQDGGLSFDFLSEGSNQKLDAYGRQLEKKAENAFRTDPSELVQKTLAKMPQLMFVLLPLFAVILKIMFIFSKRLYLEHLTVALHSHSFIFLTVLLIEILTASQHAAEASYPVMANAFGILSLVLLSWVPIYLFMMQKRIYRQGYILTSLKYSAIGIIYLFLIIFTGFIAFIWGLIEA